MLDIIEQAKYCLNVIKHGNEAKYCGGKLYRNTNENLTSLLTNYDFLNKKVLTVLSSSDQLFSCYYLGASNVDTFDINILTYYYFFLRKWSILYGSITIPKNNQELLKVISYHNNTLEEIKAYHFWKYVISNINSPLYFSKLFYIAKEYDLPYQNDINNLKSKIINIGPNYQQMNIFKPINIERKYQIIILSNILEYLYDNIIDENIFNVVASNINNLLEDNGIAISSNIINSKCKRSKILESYFQYIEGPSNSDQTKTLGYIYKKVKHDKN